MRGAKQDLDISDEREGIDAEWKWGRNARGLKPI
jgi:hypothetical protein